MVKLSKIKPKKKKGVSAIVGYVLLVTLGIIMAAIVYNYLKTYVPKDMLECPEGASLFIKDYTCNGSTMNITIKNNGRFDLAGYAIHSAETLEQEIATDSLVSNFTGADVEDAIARQGAYILFHGQGTNQFSPGNETTHTFNLTSIPKIIEITPVRYESYEGRTRFASCGNAKIKEEITC